MVSIYNRTRERAIAFAEKHQISSVYSEDHLPQALTTSPITFVATSSLTPIITEELLVQIPQGERYFFDMAVPRNVDPSLDEVPHLHLYTIDDLRSQQYLSGKRFISTRRYAATSSRWYRTSSSGAMLQR